MTRRTFAVPPEEQVAGARPRAAKRVTASPRAPRTFVAPPSMPTLRDTLDHGGANNRYPGPPRQTCECGALGWLRVESGGGRVLETNPRHASDCLYSDWPARVRLEPGDGDGLQPTKCGVCRQWGTAESPHLYWCSWWEAHPEAPAPF